jgi:gliding motility-associated-like protein
MPHKIRISLAFLLISISCLPVQADSDWIFVENQGQWNSHIFFQSDIYAGSFFLEDGAFTWHFRDLSDLNKVKHGEMDAADAMVRGHAFRAKFLGNKPATMVSGYREITTRYNYFLGNDPGKWAGNVPGFNQVLLEGLYDGIDMTVYSSGGNLKYDMLVAPGADPSVIRWTYEGIDKLEISNGNLEISTSITRLVEQTPYAYQVIKGREVAVPCRFATDGNELWFEVGDYDPARTLVIDPATLIFCSYSGSSADNWGYSATYDKDGNLYGAGIVNGTGYPIVLGAYQEDFAGGEGAFGYDIGISKFTPDGTDLVYSTYLGGSANELPHSLVVDSSGALIVYGSTGSEDFPVSPGAFDNSHNGGPAVTVTYVVSFNNGADAFITKLNADGSAIEGSTYLGGSGQDALNLGTGSFNYGDHARGEVVVDGSGNIYIASSTTSTDLPTTMFAYQQDLAGGQDGFLARLEPDLSDVVWCTYLGGSDDDGAYSLTKAPDGNFLVCGGTSSSDLPASAGSLNPGYQGGTLDGYVARLDFDATNLLSCTFIGTNNYDQVFFVDADADNNAYITGQTSGDYPVTTGVYENPGSSQFVTKLNPELSSIIYSTVFGSGTSTVNISPTALLADDCENVYVAGWGGTTNTGFNPATGTVTGMPTTDDAFSSTTTGSDFYFIVFKKNLSGLIYATFFGSPAAADHVDGGTSRFDKAGRIYQAVCAGCGGFDDFPTTDGAWSEVNASTNCNLGVIKYEFDFEGPEALFSLSPPSGCAPLEVSFSNNSSDAVNYYWDFGDGEGSEDAEPVYSFTEPGEYTITLVVEDPESCFPFDTTEATVVVYSYPEAAFTFSPNPVNLYGSAVFTDASFDADNWEWDFGDGNGSEVQNPSHQYAESGDFIVCLSVTNSAGCPDSVCQPIEVLAFSDLDVPNAFSPNGDGYNDVFLPFNLGLETYELRIYNRWGELVFITNNPLIGWDGTYEGKDQEMDTYVYVITGNGEDNVPYYRQGNLTLVR